MSLEIWLTKAGIGDCILVRCGRGNRKVNILIDSGQGVTVLDSVLTRVNLNNEKIDMLVLTHDDNDHIKGACNLAERIYRINRDTNDEQAMDKKIKDKNITDKDIKDKDIKDKDIKDKDIKEKSRKDKVTEEKNIKPLDIPANKLFSRLQEDHILFNFGGNRERIPLAARDVQKMAAQLKGEIDFHRLGFVLADEKAVDGCRYPNMIQLQWEMKNGVVQSRVIRQPSRTDLCTDKEHLELVILSPKKETLIRYMDSAWSHIDQKELLKDSGISRKSEWDSSIQHFMDQPMYIGNDKKTANNASIAFLLLYEGHSILFCGDASPHEMTEAGREYLKRSGSEADYMELDCVKLPHHGSSHNVSREFLRFFRTKRYLISTSGHAGYGHPGKGTLAEIAAALTPDGKAEIYGNYDWWCNNRKFCCAEELAHNWDKNQCKLTGTDGMSRYLDFYVLTMEPVMIEEGVQISL